MVKEMPEVSTASLFLQSDAGRRSDTVAATALHGVDRLLMLLPLPDTWTDCRGKSVC